METDGIRALHELWRGLAEGMGEEISLTVAGEALNGTFVGVDEQFAMLLRRGDKTELIPFSSCLETGETL